MLAENHGTEGSKSLLKFLLHLFSEFYFSSQQKSYVIPSE